MDVVLHENGKKSNNMYGKAQGENPRGDKKLLQKSHTAPRLAENERLGLERK